jgi:hypothetical protein
MSEVELRHMTTDTGETLLSHYRVVKNSFDQEVGVPVIDVRDGLAYRMAAMEIERSGNKSKHINYNRYHESPRKTKHI